MRYNVVEPGSVDKILATCETLEEAKNAATQIHWFRYGSVDWREHYAIQETGK